MKKNTDYGKLTHKQRNIWENKAKNFLMENMSEYAEISTTSPSWYDITDADEYHNDLWRERLGFNPDPMLIASLAENYYRHYLLGMEKGLK